jgi:hypothetical protein
MGRRAVVRVFTIHSDRPTPANRVDRSVAIAQDDLMAALTEGEPCSVY